MKKEVYIHVGYPKCASTFLQRNVYPYIDNLHFIHKYMKNKYNSTYTHFVSLCQLKNGKNLISSEQLTGSVTIHDEHCSGLEMIDRLYALYPDAYIILIEREQEKWLRSLYQQFMVDACKNIHIKNYDDWYNNHLNHDILKFKEYREKLRETFQDTLILDFDLLKQDNNTFIQKICDFMNVDFPEHYIREKAMIGLKNHHFKLIRIMGRLGLCEFNKNYLLGLLRKINKP